MSSLSIGRRISAGIALLLVASGCSPYGPIRTEVRVREPSRVSLRSLDDPERTVLPEGSQPARATLREGRLVTGDGASAAYRVDALREPGGAMAFEVDMRTPIVDGERREILSSDGRIGPLDRPGSTVVTPSAPGSPDLTFPLCGSLSTARGGYRMTLEPDCSRGLAPFGGRLSTPWSNVVDARETQRVEGRSSLVTVAAVGGVLFAIPGGIVVRFAPSTSESALGHDALTTLGGALLGAGVALGVYAIVAAAVPDRVRVLVPAGGAMAVP